MQKISAGLLLYKIKDGKPLVFLAHPGGPFYKNKEDAVWDIPKGQLNENEELLAGAKREFFEETGFSVPEVDFLELTPVKRKDGRMLHIWAFEGDCNPSKLVSNTCMFEWPPKSGKQIEIPEIDRGAFFTIEEAKVKVYPSLVAIIKEFEQLILK